MEADRGDAPLQVNSGDRLRGHPRLDTQRQKIKGQCGAAYSRWPFSFAPRPFRTKGQVMADAVISILIQDVSDRALQNIKEEIRDTLTGQGFTYSTAAFTPEAADTTALAGVAADNALVRTYSA